MEFRENLSKDLPTDNPIELMKTIAEAEVHGDAVAILLFKAEHRLAELQYQYDVSYGESLSANSKEKVVVAEAKAKKDAAHIKKDMDATLAEIKYYKKVGALIENRCSVGQSFLSHSTAMIKAGINL